MTIGACGWIGALICCIFCSGMMCFVIFGGTIVITFLALFTAINQCEGSDLVAAQKCTPFIAQLANSTVQFEPRFDYQGSEDLNKLIKMCEDAIRCMKEVNCLSYRLEFIRSGKRCDVYSFIKEEFGACSLKLKQKATEKNVDCLKFLFQTEQKCERWVENQKCIDKEIQDECGHTMLKKFGQASKDFMLGTCTRAERTAAGAKSVL